MIEVKAREQYFLDFISFVRVKNTSEAYVDDHAQWFGGIGPGPFKQSDLFEIVILDLGVLQTRRSISLHYFELGFP